MPTYATELWLPSAPESVFPFFADAGNLPLITPPWLHFRLVSALPIVMAVGTRIDYHLRVHGVPVRWQSEITVWEPPVRFVDEQRAGPYQYWRHEHSFVGREGGTLAGDRVDYAVPGGAWLGRWVARWLVAPDLVAIFAYRQARLRERFGATAPVDG